MNDVEIRSEEIARRLCVLPGPVERLAELIERSKRLPAPRDAERCNANLVPGCSSRVWLVGELVGDQIQFRADADSRLVKGLVTLLWEVANNQCARDLADAPDVPTVLVASQLDGQLSPTRLHGVGQVWRRMRALAALPCRSGVEPAEK